VTGGTDFAADPILGILTLLSDVVRGGSYVVTSNINSDDENDKIRLRYPRFQRKSSGLRETP